jgi:PAS domain S-box-containing protein
MPSAYAVPNQTITVLLIEDNLADTRLIREMLPDLQIGVAARLTDGLDYLTRELPDVILLDLSLPDSEGVETVRHLRSIAPNTAIIVITRFEDEDIGIQAIHNGAMDYLVKGQIDSRTLQRAIRYALERQQSEATLRESEERFRVMFEQAAVGLAHVGIDGRFRFVNQRLCDMFGYSREELLQMTFADITYAGDLQKSWANLNRLLTGERQDYTIEKRYVRKDGQIIWASLTATLVWTETGEPKHFLSVVQDITHRKEAEEAKLYLAAIVESSEDSIIGKTLDGIITSWNAAAERIYGWTADEAIGQSVTLLVPPGYEQESRLILAKIRQGEPISGYETKRVRKNGKLLDIALTISPIKDAAGHLIGASAIERDITTLKWAQAARQESEQRLRQLTDNIDEVLWLRDVQTGQMLYVSAAFTTLWGGARDQLYERPHAFIEYVHPEDRERVLDAVQQYPKGDFDDEYRIVRPDGQVRWIRAHTLPIRNEAGEIYRVAGIAEDITEYKRLVHDEQEQRALAEALRDISNTLNRTVDMTEILDRLLTNIERVVPHDAAEIMLLDGERARIVRSRGYASRGLQEALNALDFTVSETPNLHYMHQSQKPLIVPDVEQTSEDRALKKSPALFWRSYAGVPICTKDEVIGFINLGSLTPYFFTPVHADRLQAFAEQAAIAIQNARMYEETRELAAHQERQRLARDLHDAVSQTLFAATITTETLLRKWERDPASVGPKLAELHQLTRGALAETRAVLLELRPESLTDINFKNLLEQLVEAIQSRKQLDILLELDYADDLSSELKLVLYRITQEALNNIVKHAQASQVNIHLTGDSARLILEIRDDGVGFDMINVQPTSMGLRIMRERAEGAGATIDIRSTPGEGTHIAVRWENHTGKGVS